MNVTRIEKEIQELKTRIQELETMLHKHHCRSTPEDVPRKRNQLRKLVSNYAKLYNLPHAYAWEDVYTECKAQMNIDFITRAKNKCVRPIDYICGNGYIDDVIRITRSIL